MRWGATGSSESKRKLRSPPLALIDRPDRGTASTPLSRGTRQSGISPAPTPPRSAQLPQGAPTLVTRKSSATSIRPDAVGRLASISAEQASAQIIISLQHHCARDRQYYGPVIIFGRTSPRMVQVGSIMLPSEGYPDTSSSSSRTSSWWAGLRRRWLIITTW